MFRSRLRTLLIAVAIGPPLLALGWGEYAKLRERRLRERDELIKIVLSSGTKLLDTVDLFDGECRAPNQQAVSPNP